MNQDHSRPTVSVVIPVKNDAEHLRRCLAALAAQTVTPDEVVVVDNQSTDRSVEVALGFDVRVVAEPRPGIAAASATGYDTADGDLIARLDADCIPAPDWIESILRAFAVRPELSAVSGGAEFTDGPPALRRIARVFYVDAYFLLIHLALGHVPLFGSNAAFRRSAWLEIRDQVHRFDTLIHDDMDLSMHLGPLRHIAYDSRLGMGISMRPLLLPRTMPLRTLRALRSLTVHYPSQFPWLRWVRRVRAQRGRGVTAERAREVG
jgi:glycosyltransferase involved in cell wall biosynthesis